MIWLKTKIIAIRKLMDNNNKTNKNCKINKDKKKRNKQKKMNPNFRKK